MRPAIKRTGAHDRSCLLTTENTNEIVQSCGILYSDLQRIGRRTQHLAPQWCLLQQELRLWTQSPNIASKHFKSKVLWHSHATGLYKELLTLRAYYQPGAAAMDSNSGP